MQRSMVGHSRGQGRGRPNGRACYHSEYPPHEDAQDTLDPPYYVQDLNKQRSLGRGKATLPEEDIKKMPEDYRHATTNEPLYHQPPTPLETQDRYQGGCVAGEVPGLVAPGGNSLTSPYFAQHQLRMGQGSGRRFSPLRLPLGASRSSWRGCSWRCTTVVFVCVTLCLATTTTFFATSQVGRWHSPEGCQETDAEIVDVTSTSAHNQPVQRKHPLSPGNPGLDQPSHEAPSVSSLSSMSVGVAAPARHTSAHPTSMHHLLLLLPHITAPHVSVDLPHVYGGGRRRRSSSPRSPPPARSPQHVSSPQHVPPPPAKSPPQSRDDLHVYSWSVMDVSQEFTAVDDDGDAVSGQGDVDRSLSHTPPSPAVSRTPSAPGEGRGPRVSGSTGNKLSTLDTRSSGIDLVGGEERQPLLARPTPLQEGLIPLNHWDGVADDAQEEPEMFVAHDPATARHVRSASDHETGLSQLLPSRTLSPRRLSLLNLVYASAPPPSEYNSSSPTLTPGNAPSGATADQPTDVPASSVSGAGAQLPSGASSTALMNNPDTLGIGSAHGHIPQSAAGTEAPHYVITATAAAATTAPGVAPADSASRDRIHTTHLTDGENVILEERWSGVLVSREGVLSPDHTAAPTSGVLEETPPLGNASLHDYEYQVTPETVATPRILPSFLEATPTLTQHGTGHSQSTDDLQRVASANREGHQPPADSVMSEWRGEPMNTDVGGVEGTSQSTQPLTDPDTEGEATTETTASHNTTSPHTSEDDTAADQIRPDPVSTISQTSAYDQVTTRSVLEFDDASDNFDTVALHLTAPVDLPPSSTVVFTPVGTPIMTDASALLVDSLPASGRRPPPPEPISITTVVSPAHLPGEVETNKATEAAVDPPPAATTTAGAETAAQEHSRTAISASPTKPLSDEPITPGRLEANNTNIADFRWGSGANHSEDGVMPDPQVAPTINHKVRAEQREGRIAGQGGQEGERDHSTKLFSPYEDNSHRDEGDFQGPGGEAAAIKNSTSTLLQEGHQKPVFSALRIIKSDAVDAEEREDKDALGEGSFQASPDVVREHGGMQKSDVEQQDTEERRNGSEIPEHNAETQQGVQSSQLVGDHSKTLRLLTTPTMYLPWSPPPASYLTPPSLRPPSPTSPPTVLILPRS
ncbi:uncharacterized protein [Panulirus ornatus]|uniref:uncharacterized protein isoform X5 n=1 Tax=Panulirus ornatus TaxID=150431 RepID=UPI003A835ABA